MSKNLVIVESPAKAKTIEGYLGKDFKVASSMGHVRDLPKGGGAIDDAIAKHSLGKQEQIVVLSIDSNPTLEAVVPILVAGLGMLGLNFLVLLVTPAAAASRRTRSSR